MTHRPAGPKRSRRSPSVVRALLIDSAHRNFTRRGYSGTSTKEIAVGAGVSEALLFRHFGTKATLFEHAVVEPFTRYLDDYLVRWTRAADSEAGVEELTGDYLGGLFDLFREHRELVVALVAAYAHEDQFSEVLSEALSGALSRNSAFAAQEARRRGYALYDAELTPRVFLATVVGMAVIDGWLAPASQPAHSRDDIVQEMTSILVQGIDGREKRHT